MAAAAPRSVVPPPPRDAPRRRRLCAASLGTSAPEGRAAADKGTAPRLICSSGAPRMDAMLNLAAEAGDDYYQVLGCDELSTTEQILAEFKAKALSCHPDKHPQNPKAVEQFQKLQQAKETLTNEERRARYDHWYRSRIAIPFHQWEAMSDAVKMTMHWAVRSKKEPMLEAPTADSESSTKEGDKRNDGSSANMEQVDSDGAGIEETRAGYDGHHSGENPASPRIFEVNDCHYRFRWLADSPSELLRKFRNYEI
ncbi:dnaJ homolog subfamily C member 12 [Narcine bancroftii]|uniref:dnaJ homolog subfamily C member 12 n=1 Tax=Narcine bancroftii TaxID=1343680 RepID=UPI0038316FEF